MTHFFDTSLMVAAFDDQDAHHERALPVFTRHALRAAIATHSLAETFSILTGRRSWRASDAFDVLRTSTGPLQKLGLDPAGYLQVIKEAEGLGIRGGAIYDALILACARKSDPGSVWTF